MITVTITGVTTIMRTPTIPGRPTKMALVTATTTARPRPATAAALRWA